jgi:PhnB protein
MNDLPTPSGTRPSIYPAVIPYLTVANAEAVITFLESAFGATRQFIMPEDHGKITHGEIRLGDNLIMISDAGPASPPIHLCHYVADVDAIYAKAIAAGAISISEPETKPYGDRMGGVTDPAGNTWWICARVS